MRQALIHREVKKLAYDQELVNVELKFETILPKPGALNRSPAVNA